VADDGAGLPEGFELESSTGLGLSIVRTLVTTELGGEIEISPGGGSGARPGTVVTLTVPLHRTDPAGGVEAG
jgi:two-component sensor histidine kinase